MADSSDDGRNEHEGLDENESRKCDEAFSAFDKDNSGFIDA